MNVTVILATYNRCGVLAEGLESISAQQMPSGVEWEVLVVDNNSNDQTREVVEGFAKRFPGRFRYYFEGRQGKSYALNSGIREARGEILAFVDDDVTMEPIWLQQLTANLHSGEWAGTGGRTLPRNPGKLPNWFSLEEPYNLGGIVCALFDRGDKPCDLDRAPYGANMAFRRDAFEKFGMYRVDLGPSTDKTTPRPNEDTEFGRRVMSGGGRIRYEPLAVVYHPVLNDRIDKNYLLTWWFDYGRALILEHWKRAPILGIPRQYFSIPSLVIRSLIGRTLKWIFSFEPKRRFYSKCWVWMTLGEIVEIHRQASRPARTVEAVHPAA